MGTSAPGSFSRRLANTHTALTHAPSFIGAVDSTQLSNDRRATTQRAAKCAGALRHGDMQLRQPSAQPVRTPAGIECHPSPLPSPRPQYPSPRPHYVPHPVSPYSLPSALSSPRPIPIPSQSLVYASVERHRQRHLSQRLAAAEELLGSLLR